MRRSMFGLISFGLSKKLNLLSTGLDFGGCGLANKNNLGRARLKSIISNSKAPFLAPIKILRTDRPNGSRRSLRFIIRTIRVIFGCSLVTAKNSTNWIPQTNFLGNFSRRVRVQNPIADGPGKMQHTRLAKTCRQINPMHSNPGGAQKPYEFPINCCPSSTEICRVS